MSPDLKIDPLSNSKNDFTRKNNRRVKKYGYKVTYIYNIHESFNTCCCK